MALIFVIRLSKVLSLAHDKREHYIVSLAYFIWPKQLYKGMNSMKKYLLLLPLLFSGAATAESPEALFGLKVGVESLGTDLSHDSVAVDSLGRSESVMGAYMGYQIPFVDGLKIAVEAEYKPQDIQFNYTEDESTQALSFDSTVAISTLIKGSYTDNVDLYLRLGVGQAQVELTSAADEVSDEKLTAGIVGLGVEFLNESDMALRLEYRYTDYEEVDAFELDDTAVSTDFTSHAFHLGIHYRF